MTDRLPKLPEGLTRKDLNLVYVMTLEEGYTVWVDGVAPEVSPVDSLEKDFLAADHESREHALAEAREYAWLLAAKYLLDVEEY